MSTLDNDYKIRIEQLEARNKELEAVIYRNDNSIAVTFGLTPKMAELLGLLLGVNHITAESPKALGIATDTKVAVHRLRGLLKPFKVEIKSLRGNGYWIDDENKARIRQLVEDAAGKPDTTTPNTTTPNSCHPQREDTAAEAA